MATTDPFGPPTPIRAVGTLNGRLIQRCDTHGEYRVEECPACRAARFDAVELVDDAGLAQAMKMDTWTPIRVKLFHFKMDGDGVVEMTTEGRCTTGGPRMRVTRVDPTTYRVQRVTP